VAAQAGDIVTIVYRLANLGTKSSGSFSIAFHLTGANTPSAADPLLGATSQSSLAVGAFRTSQHKVRLPSGLAPGAWRVGVVLDRAGTTGDTRPGNNAGASIDAIRIERAPIDLAPGQRATGALGPLGRDGFRMTLFAGTVLKLKSTVNKGALSMLLTGPDGVTPLQTTEASRKVKVIATVPAHGTYLVWVESKAGSEADYEIRAAAKKLKRTMTVRGRDGLRPTASFDALDAAEIRHNRSGTRVKVKINSAPKSGILELILDSADGPAGAADLKIVVKSPKKGDAFSR
jgi:hypothetical protein